MTALDDLFSNDEERAERALDRIAPEHLPELLAAAGAADPDRRWWAVQALARLPAEDAGEAVLRALRDSDAGVRAGAVFALGKRGQRGSAMAVTPLLGVLADPSEYLARLATDALAQLGAAAVHDLIAALDTHPSPRVRAGVARALAAIGNRGAIPALFKALEDESILVQYWADEGLERMGVGQVYFMP